MARAFSGQHVSEETREQVLAVAKELGYVHNSIATTLALKTSKSVYCFIIGTIDEGYSHQMIKGINEVANIWNGYNFEIKIFITDINQQGNKCNEQLEQFYGAMEGQHPDGVILSALSQKNLDAVSSYCQKHRIPLMTMDLIFKNAELCHIGPDYYNFGVMSASYLAGQMRKKGRVLTICYDDGYQLSKMRMDGFFHRLQEIPGIECRNVDVDNIGYGTYKNVLKKFVPEFRPDAVYAPYKMDHIIHALQDLGFDDDFIMISNGINEEIEKFLFDGTICGIVTTRPYQMGAVAANNFFKYFYRATEVFRDEINVGCDIYIKENYDRFGRIF